MTMRASQERNENPKKLDSGANTPLWQKVINRGAVTRPRKGSWTSRGGRLWEGKYAREAHGSEGLFGKVCDLGQVGALAVDENQRQGLRGVLLFPVWETETRLPMRIYVTFTAGNVCPASDGKVEGTERMAFSSKQSLRQRGLLWGGALRFPLTIYIFQIFI